MIISSIISGLKRIGSYLSGISDDNKGVGVVEVILILVVLIGLVVIFREQLTGIVNSIFGRIAEDANAL